MNYLRVYNEIIANAGYRKLPNSVYVEKHHIIPRCMGGLDEASNLVNLTAKEHFICHLLLVKIYKEDDSFSKLLHAFMCMLWQHNDQNQKRYKVNARLYEKLRKQFSENQSLLMTGEKNSNYGSFWITNPISHETKKTKTMIDGWILGRNVKLCLCKNCGSEMITSRSEKNARVNCRKCIDLIRSMPKKTKVTTHPRKKIPTLEYSCVVCQRSFFTKHTKTCSKECAKIFSTEKSKEKIMIAIIDDMGHEFQSLTEAAKFHNVSVEAVRLRLKSGKYQKMEHRYSGS